MKVIAVANRKGGIGKTATVATLAALLGTYNQKVLVGDCNPGQANVSRYFNLRREIDTIADIFINGNMDEMEVRSIIKHTQYPNIDILPANETLYRDESYIPVNTQYSENFILRNALSYLKDDYDFVILDCGPNTNIFVMNALCASDGVLIPVQDEAQSYDGFLNLLGAIYEVQAKFNPELDILGVFFTRTNPITNTYKQYYMKYKKEIGDKLLDIYIRSENKFKEAVSNKVPVPLPYYVKYSNALLDYERLLQSLNLLSGKAATELKVKIRLGEAQEKKRKKKSSSDTTDDIESATKKKKFWRKT